MEHPLRRIAFWLALKKPAGGRIPGEGKTWDDVDCYTIELFDENRRVVLEAHHQDGYEALELEEKHFRNKILVSFEEAWESKFEVRRYYGWHRFIYKSALQLLFSELTLRPFRGWLRERIAQGIYNFRTPTRRDRVAVLQSLIEHDIEKNTNPYNNIGENGLSHISVAELVYGRRLFGHPECDRVLSETEFLLEALVDSGDVAKNNGYYRVLGNALNSVASYEEAEQKHRDQVRMSRVLATLTLMLVFVGVGQLIIGWIEIQAR